MKFFVNLVYHNTMSFKQFDAQFIGLARRWYSPLARAALFVIFFYFGFLKLVGLSPADALAEKLVGQTVGLAYFHELFIMLALIECIIGILFLIPRATRIVILIMFVHMLIVCSPLVLIPDAVWQAPFVPNLEGQYIIKNIALVALALGLVARTTPLAKK